MRGATPRKTLAVCIYNISIHAPYARSDLISMSVPPSTSFQSTLLMRGATSSASRSRTFSSISIHAPHARSDLPSCPRPSYLCCNFNPRSSCEERPSHLPTFMSLHSSFQSTLLMRGATRELHAIVTSVNLISIHAPHARSDFPTQLNILLFVIFQSTLLMRGATSSSRIPFRRFVNYFNPRSSCEERRR